MANTGDQASGINGRFPGFLQLLAGSGEQANGARGRTTAITKNQMDIGFQPGWLNNAILPSPVVGFSNLFDDIPRPGIKFADQKRYLESRWHCDFTEVSPDRHGVLICAIDRVPSRVKDTCFRLVDSVDVAWCQTRGVS